jgi:hypothetical protein
MKGPDQGKIGLVELSPGKSRAALEDGLGAMAMDWLSQIPEHMRPNGLEPNHQMAKEPASRGEWDTFEKLLTNANRAPTVPFSLFR